MNKNEVHYWSMQFSDSQAKFSIPATGLLYLNETICNPDCS